MVRLRKNFIASPVALPVYGSVRSFFMILQSGAQTLETGRTQDAAANHYRQGIQWLRQEKWKEATKEFEHSGTGIQVAQPHTSVLA